MPTHSEGILSLRLRRRIARRLRFARWSKWLLVPTIGGIIYGSRWIPWLGGVLFVLLLLETLGILIGEAQRCPMCDAPLVTIRDRTEEFEHSCPDCGFIID